MTTYILRTGSPAKTRADAVIVGVVKTAKGPVVTDAGKDVAEAYGRRLRPLLSTLGFTGKAGESVKVPTAGTIKSPLLVLVGLGEEEKLTPVAVRRAAGVGARSVSNAASVAIGLPAETPELVRAVTEGYQLGGYSFTDYKKDSRPERTDPAEVVVLSPAARQQEAVTAFERAQLVAAAVNDVRDWVNMPANDLNPPSFADAVVTAHKSVSKGRGAPEIGIRVWDEQELAEEGCGGLLAVGGSSASPPRLVRLSWEPEGATHHVALVGKGITYDTGGYWIKPQASMTAMKQDMAGAATVVQGLFAIARLGIPVKVTAWVPMAENMISGSAMRPGDVMTARNGRTVEIINTDAEGRLILCDAFVMATEEKPDILVDIATLTGHMVVALGERVAGVLGDDEVVAGLESAAAGAGEAVWRMPIPEEMSERLRSSKVADLSQYDGVRWGGGLYAAAFLREFTDGIPWGHIDIAGPAYNGGSAYGCTPPGGTGFGLATLVDFVAAQAQPS